MFVRPRSVASGSAAELVVAGWPNPEVNGEPPVIWSPAASGWAAIVNERAGATLAPDGTPFMLTPLVIAMPEKMATALGWPDEPLGFADIVELANDPEGWASVGHPEWGPFRLGKTNPNYSTSGLNFTVAEYYAAVGKSTGLSVEDLERPAAVEFASNVESSVVHYGDITMTFLNNWFATDARGTSLTYASAVAVEEKSVIDYNRGNPDGVLSAGEQPRVPREKLVADLPRGGHAVLRQPVHHPRHRVGRRRREGGRGAVRGVRADTREPGQGARVRVPAEQPDGHPHRPDQSRATVSIRPSRPPSSTCRRPTCWSRSSIPGPSCARRPACCSCSTSRARWATPPTAGNTRLDLAKAAAVSALDEFKDADEVGLWVFSTDLGGADPNLREEVPVGPIGPDRELLAERIEVQTPTNGTPLYDVAGKAYETMLDSYDPAKINAVVLLTDGVNDDGNLDDDRQQFTDLITQLQAGSEGAPVAAGADVHDLLRRRGGGQPAALDGPGHQRRPLRLQQSGDDRQGVRRRDLQLLTTGRRCRSSPSATGSSPSAPPRR